MQHLAELSSLRSSIRVCAPLLAGLFLAASAAPAHAQQQIAIGTKNGDNAFPFTPSDYAVGGEYQEVYSGSNFSGPVTIQDVAFASSTRSDVGPATFNVTIGLSTTGATPSADFAANKGTDFTQVFSGSLTTQLQANDTFDLVFPTSPFVFDPSQGNLLFDVIINQPTTSSGFALFDTAENQTRVFQSFGQGSVYVDTEGLYTQFTVTPAAVPEASTPVSFGLLLVLGGLAVAVKRKKATVA